MKRVYTLLLGLLILVACNEKKPQSPAEIDTAFTSYVSGFTSGVVSTTADISIRLVSELPESQRDELLEKALFQIRPTLKGTLVWLDNRTLAFRPEHKMEPGTNYSCRFRLDKLLDVPARLGTLEFEFRTMAQAMAVEIGGMTCLDEEDLSWQQLSGILRTADFADAEAIEQSLEGRQKGRMLGIEWTHSEDGRTHAFRIDSIARNDEKGELNLQWKGEALGCRDEGSETVSIPALDEFTLMKVNVVQQPEQYISVFFSDPVQRNQELDGLIYLSTEDALNFERRGNEVRLHPQKRLEGDKILYIDRGLRNSLGYALPKEYREELQFTSLDPAIELIGDGVILPGNEGWAFPFRAVNLSAVNLKIIRIYEENIPQFFQVNQYSGRDELSRVGRLVLKKEIKLTADRPIDYGKWNLFSLDLSELIKAAPGDMFHISLSFDRSQSLLPCAKEGADDSLRDENESGHGESGSDDPEMAVYDNPVSDGYYWNDWEDFNWYERDDPCTDAYYIYRKNQHELERNVLASNLGIIAKHGEGQSLFVAVTDLVNANPLSNVEIEIYNYQHRLLGNAKTDQQGMAEIPLDRKPFLLIAKHGAQRGYLRLDDGSALSTSMFDVSGQRNERGIEGHLYGERGVWRPGDSLYLTFVLEDPLGQLPQDHPVRFELYSPDMHLQQSRTLTHNLNGVYDFRTATEPDAVTGTWLAKIRVGGQNFSKTLRIETVKPNRLKIGLNFDNPILQQGRNPGTIQARWLHGATAGDLNADIELELKAATTPFPDYPDYHFNDPSKSFASTARQIYSGRLDAGGEARISALIDVEDQAPGMLQARFKTRVFERSGDFSVDRQNVPFAPYHRFVGVKVPKGPGWNGALYSNESNMIPIVSVDAHGRPVDISNLRVEIFDVNWRWWWDRDQSDDLGSFVRNRSEHLVRSERIATVNGKAMYELRFDEEQWGRKLIRISDPNGGHSCGQTFYVSYKGYWNDAGQDAPGGAEMLSFTTDKSAYEVGEDIYLTLPDIQEGRALVSVENASTRLRSFWVEAPLDGALQIEATPEMAPNAYINVSLVQPHSSSNDRPIRMYGIQQVKVSDANSILKPRLEMPDVLEPEAEVTMKISEESGRAMTYTIAVVDEGLLDLTRFRTPDLWHLFNAREALGIRTWDMYKYVMGALGGEMAGLLSVGGDEYQEEDGSSNASRFKPVVKFLGPFELKAGKEQSHRFTMPNYVGSVRTMVVASHSGAYGSTEKTTAVKKPLMVLATLPRIAGPNETISLPVSVFSMEPGSREVKVRLKTNSLFRIEGPEKQTLRFEEEGEQMCWFSLKVAQKTGEGTVELSAKSGSEEANHETSLTIRLPNPSITKVEDAMLDPGKNWKGNYDGFGLEGSNQAVLEISTIPPMHLSRRLGFLMNYPHGCIEQTTSAVFPQLYLDKLMELDDQQKGEIQGNVEAGIKRIQSFQLPDGGLSYWPGSGYSANTWGSSYAGHFMLEARNRGYKLPTGFMENWIRFQTRRANSWNRTVREGWLPRSSELDQAYRLYTLALAKKPAMGAMNRLREHKELSNTTRWTLAGAYALAGRKDAARQLIAEASNDIKAYREPGPTFGSTLRDRAMILEVMNIMENGEAIGDLINDLAKSMASDNWYSTQTTAFVLTALARSTGSHEGMEKISCNLRIGDHKEKLNSKMPLVELSLPFDGGSGQQIRVDNTGEGRLFIHLKQEGIPLDSKLEKMENDLRMRISYLDLEGRRIDPSQLVQGSDFMVRVDLEHPGIRSAYRELALEQRFPSGWEIRNLRLDEMSLPVDADQPDYQDIRDDRVYSYFDLEPGERKSFYFLLNASYEGRFFLPAVSCEAMYDKTIGAVEPGKWVEVIRP